MIFFMHLLTGENIIFSYKKERGRFCVYILLLLLGLAIGWIALVTNNNLLKNIQFESSESFFVLIFSLLLLAMSINLFTGYFLNTVVITDNFVIIRRGILGKLFIIQKNFIIAKRNIVDTYGATRKNQNQYQIQFLLNDRRKVKTGYLNCKKKDFIKMEERLTYKTIKWEREFSKCETVPINNLYNQNSIIIKSSFIIPVINAIPYILIFTLISLYVFECIWLFQKIRVRYIGLQLSCGEHG